jgi:hypothetical protein
MNHQPYSPEAYAGNKPKEYRSANGHLLKIGYVVRCSVGVWKHSAWGTILKLSDKGALISVGYSDISASEKVKEFLVDYSDIYDLFMPFRFAQDGKPYKIGDYVAFLHKGKTLVGNVIWLDALVNDSITVQIDDIRSDENLVKTTVPFGDVLYSDFHKFSLEDEL